MYSSALLWEDNSVIFWNIVYTLWSIVITISFSKYHVCRLKFYIASLREDTTFQKHSGILCSIFITLSLSEYHIYRFTLHTQLCGEREYRSVISWCYGFCGDGDIASKQRSTYYALTRNPNVDKSDLLIIKAFYDEHGKSYKTPLCWDCSLCRILGYTSKYGGMRNSG